LLGAEAVINVLRNGNAGRLIAGIVTALKKPYLKPIFWTIIVITNESGTLLTMVIYHGY
jgi:hypothetical protein